MKVLLISIFFICVSSFAVAEMQGTWNLLKANSHPEEGLKPFPKSIVIELIGEDEGKLMIQLPTQSKPKTYSFSKTRSKKSKTAQTYHEDTKEEYSNTETATIFYSKSILIVHLIWTKITDTEKPPTATGSYIFALSGKYLDFTRTNKYQNKETVLKARYSRKE